MKCCLLGSHILEYKDLGSPPIPITPTKFILTKNWGLSLPFYVIKGSLKTVIVSMTVGDGSIFKQQINVGWIIQERKNFIYKITFSLWLLYKGCQHSASRGTSVSRTLDSVLSLSRHHKKFLPGPSYILCAGPVRGGLLPSGCRSIHPRICDLIPLRVIITKKSG